THLPQVAAYAAQQVLVSKDVRKGITFATARTLDDDERPEEIARLLSGSLAVASGVEHARNMLKTRRKSRSARR
ncbi:MAG: DNA repair protein RecN, partial [Ilumatobacteraceae bacterium]